MAGTTAAFNILGLEATRTLTCVALVLRFLASASIKLSDGALASAVASATRTLGSGRCRV